MNKEQYLSQVLEHSGAAKPLFSPILMQFAAHHIGRSYRDFYLDHTVLVAANMRCMRDFRTDTVSCISDPAREAEALGAEFVYREEGVPHCSRYPLGADDDPASLATEHLMQARRIRDRIAAVELYAKTVDPGTPVIGWIEGPLALACDVMPLSEMLMAMLTDAGFTENLLDIMVETGKRFAKAQAAAGADIIGIGDAICSQIGPEEYRQWVLPRHRELAGYIQGLGAMVKLHICGDITHLLPDLASVGVDILDIDWQVDLEYAHSVLGDDVVRCGNLDPVAVIEQGSPAEIERLVREIVRREQGRPFILSGGCEITTNTPAENLLAMSSYK